MDHEDIYIHPCVKQFTILKKARGMNTQDVADLTGININTIRSYESGRLVPSLAFMTKMACAVGGTGVGIEGWT